MNLKAYLLASLILPFFGLVFIIIGSSIDSYTGHLDISKEIANGRLSFLALGYLLFILICLITTFIIIFFIPLILKSFNIYNKKSFLLFGALTGTISTIITLALITDGNLTKDNNLYLLWFSIAGTIYGILSVSIYSKFAYALDICD